MPHHLCLGFLDILLGHLRSWFNGFILHHISVTLALGANSLIIQTCSFLPGVPAFTQNVLDALLGDLNLEREIPLEKIQPILDIK